MATKFAIFRRESCGGYSTRGPVVPAITLEEARKEITRLKTSYPQQDFVIMAEMGTVSRSERVTVRIEAPDISKRVRKPAKLTFDPNVIPIRKEESR
jgi:hypothetical protein